MNVIIDSEIKISFESYAVKPSMLGDQK